jgi:hypothetical protein
MIAVGPTAASDGAKLFGVEAPADLEALPEAV